MTDFWLGVLVTICVVQCFAWLVLWAVAWGPMKWVAKVRHAVWRRETSGDSVQLGTEDYDDVLVDGRTDVP